MTRNATIRFQIRAALAVSALLAGTAAGSTPARTPTSPPVAADGSDSLNASASTVLPFAPQATGKVDVTNIPAEPIPAPAAESEPEEQAMGTGMASWYGPKFAGRRTASGETFNPRELTAAHRDLPFGSLVRVTYPRTGRSVVVRINDRGPFARNRVIDLSEAAASHLGLKRAGHGQVELALIEG